MTITDLLITGTHDYLQVALARAYKGEKEYDYDPFTRIKAHVPELQHYNKKEIIQALLREYNRLLENKDEYPNLHISLTLKQLAEKLELEDCQRITDQTVNKLALQFSKDLRTILVENFEPMKEDNLWEDLIKQNKEEWDDYKFGPMCASHEYTDSNEVMAEAFKKVMGVELNLQSSDLDLVNLAWLLAKRSDFFYDMLEDEEMRPAIDKMLASMKDGTFQESDFVVEPPTKSAESENQ